MFRRYDVNRFSAEKGGCREPQGDREIFGRPKCKKRLELLEETRALFLAPGESSCRRKSRPCDFYEFYLIRLKNKRPY